ncbi:hypothetical protein P4S72_02410, partial [Vibrio sp. PP-XX7]
GAQISAQQAVLGPPFRRFAPTLRPFSAALCVKVGVNMKLYFKKSLWFLLGFFIFIVIEGFAYHVGNVVDPSNRTGSNGIALIGGIIFILWALILGFLSARKNQYNWPFITGSTLAYIIASTSLKPIFITLFIFSLWHAVFKGKHIRARS